MDRVTARRAVHRRWRSHDTSGERLPSRYCRRFGCAGSIRRGEFYPQFEVIEAGARPATATLKARVEALQAELAKVEAFAAGHRADFERERACQRLGRSMP
jgi:hypothetical protein